MGQPEQSADLRVLPFRFLHPTTVPTALSHRARIPTIAGLAPLLILRQLVKPTILSLFVDLGASQFAAAGHDEHRCLLAALEAPYHRINHAVVDQRLQALRGFHSASWQMRGPSSTSEFWIIYRRRRPYHEFRRTVAALRPQIC